MTEAAEYTIADARNAGNKPNPHGGELTKWYLQIKGFDGEVYTQKKPGNDLHVGDQIYGRIEQGEYGWRFFGEQRPDGEYKPANPNVPGGVATGSQNVQSSSYGDKDRQISRAVAFKGAVELTTSLWLKDEDPERSMEHVVNLVETYTDKLLPIVTGEMPGPPDPAPTTSTDMFNEVVKKNLDKSHSPPTQEQIGKAFDEYMASAGEDDQGAARNRWELKRAALGIEPEKPLTDEQAVAAYKFLKTGFQVEEGISF